MVLNSNRRQFLSTLGLVAGGLAISSQSADAYMFGGAVVGLDTSKMPQEWVRRQGPNLKAYARYIKRLRLRNISVQQVIVAHARRKGSVWNTLPPKSTWPNMRKSLLVADKMVDRVGRPLKRIASAYRSPAYNARCPGAKPRSWHKRNFALDLQFHASPWTVTKAARQLRREGYFKGGIGHYSSFTHVDTRGHNVDW